MASQNETTEHQHGKMDIADHRATFAGFVRFSTWTSVLAIVVLLFMALTNA